MMRTLLDRLLFALPSPPSRASLVRGGLYLLFGLLLYGLFLGVLYVRELGVVGPVSYTHLTLPTILLV